MSETRPPTQPSGLGPDDTIRDEDLLYASGSAHFHATSQAIRFPGDVSDAHETAVRNSLDAGDLEPVPVQVTARNRHPAPVRVRSEWDGVQLHLDICSVQPPQMALQPALAAVARFYADHRLKLAALCTILVTLAVLAALAVLGVL